MVEAAKWQKVISGKGLGDDYNVPANDMGAVLQGVCQQERLFAGERDDANRVTARLLERCRCGNDPGDLMAFGRKVEQWSGACTALAAVLWFRERVRYSRVYADR